jgi:hypothetical protein
MRQYLEVWMPWREGHDLSAFDQEAINLLAEAVQEALRMVQQREGVEIANVEACRYALARYIIEHAKTGERDKAQLVQQALFQFCDL